MTLQIQPTADFPRRLDIWRTVTALCASLTPENATKIAVFAMSDFERCRITGARLNESRLWIGGCAFHITPADARQIVAAFGVPADA